MRLMPLGTLHYHLLLMISGFVLLMQTVVKSHHHQSGSYHDSQSAFHAPASSLALEHAEFLIDIVPANSVLKIFSLLIITLFLTSYLGMTIATRHDQSPSRAPPRDSCPLRTQEATTHYTA
jgi:hypothetical protein